MLFSVSATLKVCIYIIAHKNFMSRGVNNIFYKTFISSPSSFPTVVGIFIISNFEVLSPNFISTTSPTFTSYLLSAKKGY